MNLRALIFALFLTSVCQGEPPVLDIKGPTTARSGDIIVLDASGSVADHYNWLVDVSSVDVPGGGGDGSDISTMVSQLKALGYNVQSPGDDSGPLTHILIDGGKKVITASYPGIWRFYLAGSNSEGVVQKSWTVKIGTFTPDSPPKDDPKDPPKIPEFGLADQVSGWVSKVPASSQSQKSTLKESLHKVGTDCVNGVHDTPDACEKAVGEVILQLVSSGKLNSSDWSSFGQSLNLAFTALRATGSIKTPQDYGYAVLEVAGGL